MRVSANRTEYLSEAPSLSLPLRRFLPPSFWAKHPPSPSHLRRLSHLTPEHPTPTCLATRRLIKPLLQSCGGRHVGFRQLAGRRGWSCHNVQLPWRPAYVNTNVRPPRRQSPDVASSARDALLGNQDHNKDGRPKSSWHLAVKRARTKTPRRRKPTEPASPPLGRVHSSALKRNTRGRSEGIVTNRKPAEPTGRR